MLFAMLLVAIAELFAEQEGSTPQAGEPNNRVDNAAEQGILSAKQPGHQVELKDSHKPPVDTADDR